MFDEVKLSAIMLSAICDSFSFGVVRELALISGMDFASAAMAASRMGSVSCCSLLYMCI